MAGVEVLGSERGYRRYPPGGPMPREVLAHNNRGCAGAEINQMIGSQR